MGLSGHQCCHRVTLFKKIWNACLMRLWQFQAFSTHLAGVGLYWRCLWMCARLLLHQAPAAALARVDQRRGCQVYCSSTGSLLEVKKLMQRPSQALGQDETESCQLFLLSSSRSSGCGVSSSKAEMVLIKTPWKWCLLDDNSGFAMFGLL